MKPLKATLADLQKQESDRKRRHFVDIQLARQTKLRGFTKTTIKDFAKKSDEEKKDILAAITPDDANKE